MEKQLFDLKPGMRFTYGEVEWVLLDMSGPGRRKSPDTASADRRRPPPIPSL